MNNEEFENKIINMCKGIAKEGIRHFLNDENKDNFIDFLSNLALDISYLQLQVIKLEIKRMSKIFNDDEFRSRLMQIESWQTEILDDIADLYKEVRGIREEITWIYGSLNALESK